MIYGYARVSSTDQNLDRQLEAFNKVGVEEVYSDKMSGKNFNREQYQKMKDNLQKGDLLYIKSIDRLGRNYDMIIDEWRDITHNIGANIVVIDMPLLDTRDKDKGLTGKFISDIVLQILSYVAETERNNIKQRQAEGIRIAKEKGIHMGRPKYELPKNRNECKFQVFIANYKNGWQHKERYCSIMKNNYDCICSKENCPLKPLTDRLAEERKKVVQEIREKLKSDISIAEDYFAVVKILDQVEKGE